MDRFDVAVIGAGAAGLYCAGLAGQRGLGVVVLDHAERIGEKIRISGGGRCNFTNRDGADHRRYLSGDPRFARAALRAHPPQRFIERVRAHRIPFHEKHRGQLFCDDSSQRIIDLLRAECGAGRVELRHPLRVVAVERGAAPRFVVVTDRGRIGATHLVVACGGLSVSALGASDFAWRLAAQWGIASVAPRPGLVPLTFTAQGWQPFAALAGLALPVRIALAGIAAFDEDLLFSHRGLSGPAILQISSYWHPGDRPTIDLGAGVDLPRRLLDAKAGRHGGQLAGVLAELLPKRLARTWLVAAEPGRQPGFEALAGLTGQERIAEIADARLRLLGRALQTWSVTPAATEGYRKAEVTVGGIATTELEPATLEARRVPGSYWIGEAVDVTGWLGGYNFQWAWSSAAAAAQAIALPR
ncbi:MAG: NAD(P)/FAD-dependent oxidoreductase [Lautropia sp.]